MTTPVTEVEQLKQQNALLLKRLLVISRQRDELAKRIAARPDAAPPSTANATVTR